MTTRTKSLNFAKSMKRAGIHLHRGYASGTRDAWHKLNDDYAAQAAAGELVRFAFTTVQGEHNWREYGAMQVYAGVMVDGYDQDGPVYDEVAALAEAAGLAVSREVSDGMHFLTLYKSADLRDIDERRKRDAARLLILRDKGYTMARCAMAWWGDPDHSWRDFEDSVEYLVMAGLRADEINEPESWLVRTFAYRQFESLRDARGG